MTPFIRTLLQAHPYKLILQSKRADNQIGRSNMRRLVFGLFIEPLFLFAMTAGVLAQGMQSAPKSPQSPPRVYQLVMFKLGPAWIKDKAPLMQPGIQEHAAYMSKLIKEGILVLGGALFEDPGLTAANGAVMILAVDTPDAGRKMLESDPANRSGLIQIVEIRPLMITGASWRPPQTQ
jgi:uncharacterized protein YciI